MVTGIFASYESSNPKLFEVINLYSISKINYSMLYFNLLLINFTKVKKNTSFSLK